MFKPKKIQLPPQSKLSEAERLDIPKGDRNQKQIGVVDDENRKFKVSSDLFGPEIGYGSEQIVFDNAQNPQLVLKAFVNRNFSNESDIKRFHKNFFKRNQIPHAAKIKYEGYLKGKERLYPVYSQQKLNIPNNSVADWNNIHLPKINEILHNAGYKGIGTYHGKFNIGDISPSNIGYDDAGKLYFTDADVYKKGGSLKRK